MSEFRTVEGFEDVWRAPVRLNRRTPETVLAPHGGRGGGARERLARLVGRAPEVMVKVSGRTRSPEHLRAHLDYISRKGDLEMEDREGHRLAGRGDVRELAGDWTDLALADRRRRANTPMSLSLILSMPAGTDPLVVRDAARSFAADAFGDRFDYVFALHTDTPRPHVHIAVAALGDGGARLNPRKADLETWRQLFAQALRDRGIAAEASPRRARGVTRKAEHGPVRRMRERHQAGKGALPRVVRSAYQDAARAVFSGELAPTAWETRSAARQTAVRRLYLAQARLLQGSADSADRRLGAQVAAFVSGMPMPDSQRLALARELRAANARLTPDRDGIDRQRRR